MIKSLYIMYALYKFYAIKYHFENEKLVSFLKTNPSEKDIHDNSFHFECISEDEENLNSIYVDFLNECSSHENCFCEERGEFYNKNFGWFVADEETEDLWDETIFFIPSLNMIKKEIDEKGKYLCIEEFNEKEGPYIL